MSADKKTVLQRVAADGHFTRAEVEALATELEQQKENLQPLVELLERLPDIELDDEETGKLETIGGGLAELGDALDKIAEARAAAEQIKEHIETFNDHADSFISEWESWADETDRETKADYRETLVGTADDLDTDRLNLSDYGVDVDNEY